MADAGFRDYEREFQRLTGTIPSRVEAVLKFETDQEAQAAELRRIESDLTQGKQMVNSMQIEVRGLAEPLRSQLGNAIRTYQSSLTTLSTEVAKAKAAAQRHNLLGSVTSPKDGDLTLGASKGQRERLMDATDRMSKSNAGLLSARQSLAATEEVALDITTELDRNRQTLLSARQKVGHVSGVADQARRILTSMARREVKIKIMMACFILLIIGVIAIVIYYMSNKSK